MFLEIQLEAEGLRGSDHSLPYVNNTFIYEEIKKKTEQHWVLKCRAFALHTMAGARLTKLNSSDAIE